MYFIGSGTPLASAVAYSLDAGLAVDGACCPVGDHCRQLLRKRGVAFLETGDPNDDPGMGRRLRDRIVFSINNRYIFGDDLLNAGARFFNVHNGLTQQYRGLAVVCIFAALCRGARQYGVTLHQILPGQRIDSGPVVSQIRFGIAPDDTFATVLERSLDACRRIFEANVRDIAAGAHSTFDVERSGRALGYKDVAGLCAAAPPDRLGRAADLGAYAGLFPELAAKIRLAGR